MFKIQGFDGVNLQEFEQPNIKTRLENLPEQFVFFFANQSDSFSFTRRIPVFLKRVKKCNRVWSIANIAQCVH